MFSTNIHGRPVELSPRVIDGVLMGFCCDGGTVPSAVWGIIGHPFGVYLPAFINHDKRWSYRLDFPGMSFHDSNDWLYEDCLFCNPNKVKAYSIYRGVQSFGKGIWEKGKENVCNDAYHYAPIGRQHIYGS